MEFNRWSSIRAEEQQAGAVGAAATDAAELFLGAMEGQLAGAMGAVAVGEAALNPEEVVAMDIVVHQPQAHAKRHQQAAHDRRKRKRRLEQVW